MKKAIVIGASSGIGRELAKILSRNQYTVGVMARRVQLLDELSKELDGKLFVQKIDVSDTGAAMETLKKFIDEMGGVDLVVISAGTGEINNSLSWHLENMTIMTNVSGFAALVNVAIQHFVEKGSGHLAGISSIAALRGGSESPAYNASKAFESNYLEGLRQKFRKSGLPITITDIKPGFVKTAMAKGDGIFWAAEPEEAARQIYQAIKKKKSSAYITRRWVLIAWLLKLLPGFIYERL
ncbi:MAG: SDR family NAD(P)-dependent oxidoreductase [Candidatus Riflebacteria bacterium]|nr:SDR family NAD(P)-dependent oxidoreductase [Candidatus Riflebacteria bacterium]